jgi:hypothetical protein
MAATDDYPTRKSNAQQRIADLKAKHAQVDAKIKSLKDQPERVAELRAKKVKIDEKIKAAEALITECDQKMAKLAAEKKATKKKKK